MQHWTVNLQHIYQAVFLHSLPLLPVLIDLTCLPCLLLLPCLCQCCALVISLSVMKEGVWNLLSKAYAETRLQLGQEARQGKSSRVEFRMLLCASFGKAVTSSPPPPPSLYFQGVWQVEASFSYWCLSFAHPKFNGGYNPEIAWILKYFLISSPPAAFS